MTGSEKDSQRSRQEPNAVAAKDKPAKDGTNKASFLPGLSDAEDFELAPGKGEVYQGPMKENKAKPRQGDIFGQEENHRS